jgi:hypothetical protein
LLGVSFSGNKLMPLIVFQAKATQGKVYKEAQTFDDRAAYVVSEKGFCNTYVMLEWIRLCLKPYLESKGGGVNGKLSIVMMDNFGAHSTRPVLEALSEIGVMLVSLPANTTCLTQVLDVGVNAPFKAYYKNMYTAWMAEQADVLKARVSRKLCSDWMAASWEKVSRESILNTVKKIFVDVLSMDR